MSGNPVAVFVPALIAAAIAIQHAVAAEPLVLKHTLKAEMAFEDNGVRGR